MSILNLRDWEVETLVVNMLPIHDLVDRLFILCAEPKRPLLHGCMSLWCWVSSLCGDDRTLLPNVLIICLPATHSLAIRSAKRGNNSCFICRHTKKAFPVCRELSRRDNYSSYSCSSHIPGRFLQTIYLYIYTHPKQDLSIPLIVVVLSHIIME